MIPYQYALRRKFMRAKNVDVAISGDRTYAKVALNGVNYQNGVSSVKLGSVLTLKVSTSNGTGASRSVIFVDGVSVRDGVGNYSFVLRKQCDISLYQIQYTGDNGTIKCGVIVVETNPVDIDVRGTLGSARAKVKMREIKISSTVSVKETRITDPTVKTLCAGVPITLEVSGSNAAAASYSRITIDGETVATGDTTYIFKPIKNCIISASNESATVSGTRINYGVINITTQ